MAELKSISADRDLDRTFKHIGMRRRVIQLLRFAVPLAGLGLFAYLVLPLIISSLFPAAQFDAIRISSDRLVIDAPRAKGTLSDGGRYRVSAHSAETGLANQDIVDLVDLVGDLFFVDGTTAKAISDDGRYSFIDETLELFSTIYLTSSKGDKGTIGNGVIYLSEQRFTGEDGVKFEFIDGTTLDAATMKYDSARGKWEFTKATLVLAPETVEEAHN
ncbi:hypothetical protein [Maritalea porphyrae]|uniref:LPS export ABC transporter periplasmic protein LptC n=1 Tax=Maritalea porphyrae TaxID=880732 RepID=A0ABQ5UQZ9_9HYPH|nr:hypothetical protein [Maritalea porphyrae]GLQ17200.1 hypothetical protein GCM10007879_14490 [Maritalea porphyrae]